MLKRPARVASAVGIGLIAVLIVLRLATMMYTEVLWFDGLGRSDVYWTRLGAIALVRLVTGAIGFGIVLANLWVVARHLGPVHLRRRYGNLEIAEQVPRSYVLAGIILTAALAGWWLSGITFSGESALGVLAWTKRQPWGVTDPLFNRDVSFFVFSLPVYSQLLDYLLIVTVWSIMLAIIGYVLVGAVRVRDNRLEIDENPRLHFAVLIAMIVLLFGARYWLGRYGVLLDGTGFGGGVGYTDEHARLPAQRVLAVLSVAAAGALLFGAWRRSWWPPLIAVGLFLVGSFGLVYVYPSIVQKLQVEPNELAREERYIRWNIDFTRRGFDLHDLDRRAFAYERGRIGTWQDLASRVERIPLWDPDPLRTSFNQTQTLFAYYQFPGVSYDRYPTATGDEEVAIAVREFTPGGLSPDSRTWRTLHINAEQVRGLGAVVTPAAAKTAIGDPVFWLSDVNPIQRSLAAPPEVELSEPSVYFGETMDDYLILGADTSRTGPVTRDGAAAGVPLSSFARTLAFAWRFGDKNLLFASELTRESRLIFRRRVNERLSHIAPWLLWDRDPHPVIYRGHIVWMIDGYTVSSTFPVARPYSLQGVGQLRYMRNSVKATVDAVTGAVSLYVVDPSDPLLSTYRRVFPDLLEPLDSMPAELLRHLRYPTALLQIQADVLEEYHLDEPSAFFAGRNEWQVPQEGTGATASGRYTPIHVIAGTGDEETPEFLLIMPFIARERQNMTALLIVHNDAGRYGRMTVLELPRDQQITGPSQVHTIIEQDPMISQQLSLWRGAGSNVEYGRFRVIPLENAILYIRPLFLSSSASSIPQLSRVIVSDGTAVNMAQTLSEAVNGLYGRTVASTPAADRPPPTGSADTWARDALQMLEEADRRLRNGDFAGFGERWSALEQLLQRASQRGSSN